ncbi:MAG: restriction endonuclease [Candidatus Methanoperedens sp.]
MIDWSLLSPNEFEELCTALLYKDNFYNIKKMGDANDSDRGRDITANKKMRIMSKIENEEEWIIQCKRHLVSPPNINQLKDALDWCIAHKPDGVIFFITNRLTSATVDWLKLIKNHYTFQIVTLDIDYLEDQLSKDRQLYLKFFEKTQFIKSIKENPHYDVLIGPKPKNSFWIYTAGEMPDEVERGAIGQWRQRLENEVQPKNINVTFLHPEFVGCDHGGITAHETVSWDSYMIQKSDAIVAYLNDEELYGTITEIMLAHFLNKKIAIFIDKKLLYEIREYKNSEDILEDVNKIYSKVFKTKHGCPCSLNGFIDTNKYWFILNYLEQTGEAVIIKEVNEDNYINNMVYIIEKWLST